MDDLCDNICAAFASFSRPACSVIHPNEDVGCVDCLSVANALDDTDCDALLESNHAFFAKIPMDCMTGDAFLHFFPAIATQSIRADGIGIAETLAWILGAREWDTEQTISEQIMPKLSSEQCELIRQLLTRLERLPLSPHAKEQLVAAQEFWSL